MLTHKLRHRTVVRDWRPEMAFYEVILPSSQFLLHDGRLILFYFYFTSNLRERECSNTWTLTVELTVQVILQKLPNFHDQLDSISIAIIPLHSVINYVKWPLGIGTRLPGKFNFIFRVNQGIGPIIILTAQNFS